MGDFAASSQCRRIVRTEGRFESLLPTRPALQIVGGDDEIVTVEARDNIAGTPPRPQIFGFVVDVGHAVAFLTNASRPPTLNGGWHWRLVPACPPVSSIFAR